MPTDKRDMPRVVLFSHAFHDPENRKNISSLAEHCEITVATPAEWELHPDDRDFKLNDFSASGYARELFMPLRMLRVVPGERVAHYALGSLSFGFRSRRPDVIHIDYEPWSPVFWQALAVRALFARDAAVVFSPKKNTYREHPGLTGRIKRRIAEAGLRRVTLLTPASEITRSLYESRFDNTPEAQVVTHLAIDTDVFRPADGNDASEETVVGFAGRFAEQKGVDDLIAAVERAIEGGARLRLRLLGSGPLSDQLEALARERDWLEVLPPVGVGEVADFLRTLDVFVLATHVEPDHQEHDGHALLQAMATALPAVGTRSGIIPALIDDGAGLVVEAGDVAALADAISRLAADPALRRELGAEGRRRAIERYSLAAVTEAKLRAYDRAMELAR